MKHRPSIPAKIKMRLQKEVNSQCPFCQNQDVEHFEIHHLDENPANNDISNLLLLCPICHSKITKRDIDPKEAVKIKQMLPLGNGQIEFVSVTIDSKNCAWEVSKESDFAFFKDDESVKSPFPILNFVIVNNENKMVVLRRICLTVNFLPSGIHGLPQARILKPLAIYQLQIEGKNNSLLLPNPIQVPSKQAFMFQIELSSKLSNQNTRYEIQGRKVLHFSFEFSGGLNLKAPAVYLNCLSENETSKIYSTQ
jgi:hypothetical protein